MWRITIIANVFLMGLFWLASQLSISMVSASLMPLSQSGARLPLFTDAALSVSSWSGILPLVWIILSFLAWKKVKDKEPQSRSEYLLAFTSITAIAGFSMLVFFAMAGILLFCKISSVIL